MFFNFHGVCTFGGFHRPVFRAKGVPPRFRFIIILGVIEWPGIQHFTVFRLLVSRVKQCGTKGAAGQQALTPTAFTPGVKTTCNKKIITKSLRISMKPLIFAM